MIGCLASSVATGGKTVSRSCRVSSVVSILVEEHGINVKPRTDN